MDASDDPSVSAAVRAWHRRAAGDPDDAAKIVAEALGRDDDPSLRVVEALVQLDRGDVDGARASLESVFEPVATQEVLRHDEARQDANREDALDAIGEAELDDAFLAAESRPDEMWSANHVAEATIAEVEETGPEGVGVDAGSPFATATMAGLLEQQGHAEEARALRDAIEDDDRPGAQGSTDGEPVPGDRERIIATLERWLENLRRAS